MNKALLYCLPTVLCALLLACQKDTSMRWKEDVLLNDGRVVTLDRYQEFKGPREIGQPSTESDYWFELVHPDTGEKVRWNGDRIYGTAALLIKDKNLYLLTAVEFDGWMRLNCPNPGFILWRWTDSGWGRVPLEEIPQRRIKANMTAYPESLRRSGLLEKENPHLTVGVTQNIQRQFRPWVITFEKVEKQTFGPENCAKGRGERGEEYDMK